MSDSTVSLGLAGYFEAQWSAAGRSEKIAFPNAEFEPQSGVAWLRLSIISNGTNRELMTGSRNSGENYSGSLEIQIFTPAGTGNGLALQLAGIMRGFLSEKSIPTDSGGFITLFQTSVREIGNDEHGWYQTNVSTPYSHLNN